MNQQEQENLVVGACRDAARKVIGPSPAQKDALEELTNDLYVLSFEDERLEEALMTYEKDAAARAFVRKRAGWIAIAPHRTRRKAKCVQLEEKDFTVPGGWELSQRNEEVKRIREFFKILDHHFSAQQRHILDLKMANRNITCAEMASILDADVQTVKKDWKIVKRVLAFIRDRLRTS